jgi:hypothetical protein
MALLGVVVSLCEAGKTQSSGVWSTDPLVPLYVVITGSQGKVVLGRSIFC